MQYNAYVIGVHNYYQIATHVSKDFGEIAFNVSRTINKLKRRRTEEKRSNIIKYIQDRYMKSKAFTFVRGEPFLPIGYVYTVAPKLRRRGINVYSEAGRNGIHNKLDNVNLDVLHYLMCNPVKGETVEYNDNRLALYSAQNGKCAISGQNLK